MNDKEFLGYVEIHSETELALFHRDHANRLLRMAGEKERTGLPAFVSIFAYTAKPLVARARERMTATQTEQP